ncbi:lysoplasmalogenase [Hyphococcus sp.]|uniref:lysoplasmalogenase n=1 Tax=Hyphococcus sp. TaxID=2038636 RepID=UPI003D0A6AD4
MNLLAILLVVLCGLFTGLLLWAERKGLPRLKWAAKPAASLCFVLLAAASGATESAYGIWILAALVLCMAGDVFLIPVGEKTFLAGMAAFAAGHAAYIGAFLSGGPEATPVLYMAAAGMALFAVFSLLWLWPHLGAFRGPVAGYTVIIAAMVAASFLAEPPGRAAPSLLVIAGAVGFAISDLSVARDKFVAPDFFNRAWGLPLYYTAQLLLAASV